MVVGNIKWLGINEYCVLIWEEKENSDVYVDGFSTLKQVEHLEYQIIIKLK